jgi:hypothetical protein
MRMLSCHNIPRVSIVRQHTRKELRKCTVNRYVMKVNIVEISLQKYQICDQDISSFIYNISTRTSSVHLLYA